MNAMIPSNGSMTTREDFGGKQMTATHETASTVLAAQATAAMQARYIMALQRPRDWDNVRVALLRECSRTSFAESAWYFKPIGKGVQGLTIRFAEAAIRAMTNIAPETFTVYDDPQKRMLRVSVTDLEANIAYTKDVTVEKVVERRELRKGQIALSARTNSTGQTVYLVAASEDDLLAKEGSLVSKALRTLALRLLPGDIQDECKAKILLTRENQATNDPDAERKRVADAFATLGIRPSDLKEYLGHGLDGASPAQLVKLRALFAAIREGDTTWRDVMVDKAEKEGEVEKTKEDPKPSRSQALADKIKAKAQVKATLEPSQVDPIPPKPPSNKSLEQIMSEAKAATEGKLRFDATVEKDLRDEEHDPFDGN